ncbi:hypothetical protein [Edwardsiella ictaluri]|nr:hypothetical protein [Edwardsiella ictaluri]
MLLCLGDIVVANQLIRTSCSPAPDAAVCQTVWMPVMLSTPERDQALQQARLLASGGQ